jgi:hypothetical protein
MSPVVLLLVAMGLLLVGLLIGVVIGLAEGWRADQQRLGIMADRLRVEQHIDAATRHTLQEMRNAVRRHATRRSS